VKEFPDRIKIVSEGDSWFQHPLVLDIIDHLHRVFNIYCVAAAGDTLRNYFSDQHKRGAYYLDAIENHQPEFFLISGGGNDILGSQFRTYLTDTPDNNKPEGTEPGRFVKDELFKEIDTLMELYYTTFLNLQTTHPNLQIIVHGYDYPIKLNDAKKGWLGRYMIEKGINRPGDRQAIIHLIMDEFNKRLEATAAKFPNTVTYIDVRNIVRYNEQEKVDQWYDEIHPNHDGFQQIAMKFIQAISRLAAAKHAGNGMLHETIS
jgi:lysophospholipase L1-like esterase